MKGIFTMARKLTEKQVQVLRFIYDYIKSNNCAPSLKEIAKALGISVNLAQSRRHYLIGHGCLRKSETEKYGRRIALTEKGIRACESFNKK